jgi:hypothetical protein
VPCRDAAPHGGSSIARCDSRYLVLNHSFVEVREVLKCVVDLKFSLSRNPDSNSPHNAPHALTLMLEIARQLLSSTATLLVEIIGDYT